MSDTHVSTEENFDVVAAKENRDYEKMHFTGKEHFTEDLLNEDESPATSSKKGKGKPKKYGDKKTGRVTATLELKRIDDLKLFADKQGISINDALADAVQVYLDIYHYKNGGPTTDIVANRLGELTQAVTAMEQTVGAMQQHILSSLNSLTSLARGDNYLMTIDNGDIDI